MRFLSQELVRHVREELSCALARSITRMYRRALSNVVHASGAAFVPGPGVVVSGGCSH